MIKYGDLVQYIKDNHINWNTDLFDVLRGFFNNHTPSLPFPSSDINKPSNQDSLFKTQKFKEPDDGEYSNQDLFDLFNS
jgi:hypothetical protein